MDFHFSDKYEPLFELLEARTSLQEITEKGLSSYEIKRFYQLLNILENKKNLSKKNTKRIDKEVLRLRSKGLKLSEKIQLDRLLILNKVDTVLISGGRDSGKSFALSTFNGIAAKDYNHRILYTRQTMSSTDNSITEALEGRLLELGIAQEFDVANKLYSLKDDVNGNPRAGKISITGQKTSVGTQTAKLKSLEDFSIFETDEGEELESFDSWKKTKRSMRAKDVQCLSMISFNPPTRQHWLHETFYEDLPVGFNGIVGSTMYIHTTYKDNGKENMAEHNWLEFEELRVIYEQYLATPKNEREYLPKKMIKQYKEYRYDILGEFKNVAEGVIYEDWIEGDFNDRIPYCYAIDFGFKDPDALVKVAVDQNKMLIYVQEMYFKNATGTNTLADILLDKCGRSDLIIGDAAEKRLISDLWESGLNIRRSLDKKPKRDIKRIQGFTIVVAPNSPNVKNALNNYSWSNKVAEMPNHDFSDLMDALRYGFSELMRG